MAWSDSPILPQCPLTDCEYSQSTELTSPGLAPADWQAVCRKWWVFCCWKIRMSTTHGSFQAEAPANICRKASPPHLQCSSPSLSFRCLWSPLTSGGTPSQGVQLPTWYRNTAFSHCEESTHWRFGWLRGHLLWAESQLRPPAGTWRRSKTWTDAGLYSFISCPLL